MMMQPWGVALLLTLSAMQPSFADDQPSLVGAWQVVSFEAVSPTSGDREPARHKNPSGYTIFISEGRMSVLITNEGRRGHTEHRSGSRKSVPIDGSLLRRVSR